MNFEPRTDTVPAVLHRLRRDVDGMLERFLDGSDEDLSLGGGVVLDVAESEREIVVVAEVAGADPGALDLCVCGDILAITGTRRPSPSSLDPHSHGGLLRRERGGGPFWRCIRLPGGVDRDELEGRVENGVLTIRMGKAQPATRSGGAAADAG